MTITLEQVKKDIEEGKVNAIYYSARTLWWTHLDSDVEAATEIGKKSRDARIEQILNNPNVPQEDKDRAKAAQEMANKSVVGIPLDPTGSPLYHHTTPEAIIGFIEASEKKPEHFGEHGLDAFMMSHHQNCGENCFSEWKEYNKIIDEQ